VSHVYAMSRDRAVAFASVEREWDVLLACCSAGGEQSELVRVGSPLKKQVDWDEVLRLADQHGIVPLLYQTCSKLHDAVSPGVLAQLQERYNQNVHKTLLLARELIRILDCLDALGVEAIPYKGVVLSEIYYGDMAMRQSGDMDLFVRKRDVRRIGEAVRDLGYTPRGLIPDAAWPNYIASGYERTFDSPAGKNLLELQWALQPRFYAVDYDMEGLFERAVPVTVAGRRTRTASPEDLLLVLSVHAAKHVWERLVWLCDIAQILKREKLNWDWVLCRAREYGIERILRVTLLLANRLLAMPLPVAIEKAILADQRVRVLADEIAATMSRGVSDEEQQISYFRLMVRLRERRADQFRFLSRLTFTPGPGEWEVMRLPKGLFPLYRVVRLVRLAARFGRG
jgi:Uncharacterised nucleotidyltransferase